MVVPIWSSDATAQSFQGQGVAIGEGELVPEARIDFVTVDNTFRTSDDPVESSGVILSPSANFEADRRLISLNATYRGAFGKYDESILDFDDHALSLSASSARSVRHRVNAAVSYNQTHQTAGSGQSIDLSADEIDDQIIVNSSNLRVGYIYGAANARGNIGAGVAYRSQSFSNLDFVTDGDDNTSIRPFGRLTIRVSPDTRLVAEIRFADVDFDRNISDRSDVSLLFGADLAATARTSGRLRIGVSESDFDDSRVSDSTRTIADVDLTYKLRSFSVFRLAFSRDLDTVDDTASTVNETISNNIAFTWRHSWGSRLSSTVRASTVMLDRGCPRSDVSTNAIGAELGVNVRRWVSIGLTVLNTKRNVDGCDTVEENVVDDFELTQFGFFISATL